MDTGCIKGTGLFLVLSHSELFRDGSFTKVNLHMHYVLLVPVFLLLLSGKWFSPDPSQYLRNTPRIRIGGFNSSLRAIVVDVVNHTQKESPSNITATQPLYLFPSYAQPGRFGNVMFVIASLYGIATSTQHIPVFPADALYSNLFQKFPIVFLNEDLYNNLRNGKQTDIIGVGEKGCGFFTPTILEEVKARNSTVGIYLQSFKYFNNVQGDLRTKLTFPLDIVMNATALLTNITTTILTDMSPVKNHAPSPRTIALVGVQIRRGDLVGSDKQQYGNNVAPVSYFNKSIQYFDIKLASHRLLYLIFTDDIPWATENILPLRPHNSAIVSNFTNDMLTDFYLMTRCNHFIMSVGTFGWWGAYLSGGLVTYYGEHGKPNSSYRSVYNDEDFFPPNWIRL